MNKTKKITQHRHITEQVQSLWDIHEDLKDGWPQGPVKQQVYEQALQEVTPLPPVQIKFLECGCYLIWFKVWFTPRVLKGFFWITKVDLRKRVWWSTPSIPELGSHKLVGLCEFEANQVYIERLSQKTKPNH